MIVLRLLGVIFLFSMLVLALGCSGEQENPVSPGNDTPLTPLRPEAQAEQSERILWGFWTIHFDPIEMKVSIEPERNIQAHYNVTDYILPPACDDCLAIQANSFDPVTRILDADVTIQNPMPINGRDIRGILYTNQYGHRVVNADGWTTLYDVPGGEDINPFRAFAKEVEDRIFMQGAEHTENYHIYIPSPPQYWAIRFAVDASFPGNCKEPYGFEDFSTDQILYDYVGAVGLMSVKVYDWQDDIESVVIAAPEITGEAETNLNNYAGDTWSLYLQNNAGADEGEYECLITAKSTGVDLLLHYPVTIEVIDTPAAIVTEINPDHANAGEQDIEAVIHGSEFHGSDFDVILTMDGAPDIVSPEVTPGDASILCILDIPIDAPQGLYDVEVTNAGGNVGVGEEMFEVRHPIPANPKDVTPPHLNFSPYDIAVSGTYAFVASGVNGVNVFDISNPLSPLWVHQEDSDDQAYRIAVQGDYAYVADLEGGLLIYDISIPESTSLLHSVDSLVASAVDIAGDYAYVLDRFDGFKIIDVSSPGAPTIAKTVDLGIEEEFANIDYENGYAYIATRDNGLIIIDVDPVLSASVVTTVGTDYSMYDVEVESGLAFVCNEYGKLVVYDVDPPESISVSQVLDEIVAFGVEVSGDYAYVAAVGGGFNGLAIVDISNPEDVSLTKQVETSPGHPSEVVVYGGYVILLDNKIGLRFIHVDPVNSAYVVAEIDSPSGGQDVWVENGMAFYINEWPGVVIADVSSPADTQYVQRFDDIESSGIFITHGIAYITKWDQGLQIYDVDPLGSAYMINSIELPPHPNNLFVDGEYAYVTATWDGDFHIVDINPPESASLVKTVPIAGSCTYVDVEDGHAFVTNDENGLHIIDVDPPGAAAVVKTVPEAGSAGGIQVEDGYAYIAADSFRIVDIDPVSTAAVVKTVPLPHDGKGIHLSPGFAYVTCAFEGLQIIDIDPIDSAQIISTVPVKHYAIGIDVVDNMAYIGDIESGLRIIQLW
jgi:hypothetical protein